MQTSVDVFWPEPRVISHYLGIAPTLRQKFHDKIHCQARPFYDRFSNQDFRINGYPFMPIHKASPV